MLSSFRMGVLSAVVAQVMWGLFPIYWKLLEHVPPLEVLFQRNVWCAVFLGAFVLAVADRRNIVLAVLKHPKHCLAHSGSALLIATNWLVYIWAVVNGHVIAASLGYFLSPLVSVLLGVVVFSERPRPLQWFAIALASAGVLVMTVLTGAFPWIGLTLAATFGLYGMMRKLGTTGPINGLCIESVLLVPISLIGLLWLFRQNSIVFGFPLGSTEVLLVLGGLVTAIPLVLYAQGARSMPLSLSGLLVYITPSIQFLVGWLVYREAMGTGTWIGFACIWIALFLYASALNRPQGES